jgi:hypothetical protein
MQDSIPTGCSEYEGTLGGSDGLVIRAPLPELDGQKARDLPQPTRVVKGRCESLGLAQICQDAPRVAERVMCRAQGEPEVDGLLACVARLWQMLQSTKRLLIVRHCLAVR